MTASADQTQADTTPRVYYSTSTQPLPVEEGDPLTVGDRITIVGEPVGCHISHIETGALRLAPADEQPGHTPQVPNSIGDLKAWLKAHNVEFEGGASLNQLRKLYTDNQGA